MKQKDVMNVVFLSLGGNLNNRAEILKSAKNAIRGQIGEIVTESGIYETEAWGSPSQKKYLNQVIKIKSQLTPEQLLAATLLIEKKAGRKRTAKQNADRTLDIDILFFNQLVLNRKNLQIPHPRLHQRKFVLIPLAEIEKKLVHPVLKKNINALLNESNDKLKVTLYNEKNFPLYLCIEGNIGSGKSTLARALYKKWGAAYLPEIFEENHLLPLFYADPAPFSFSMEFSFLISRFQQITDEMRLNRKMIVSDYSIFKSLWFAKVNLPEKEFRIFKKHFKTLAALLPQPDLIVYLDTSIENVEKNIRKRGRPYEEEIKNSYLRSVARSYKKGMKELGGIKKLVVPVKNYHQGLETELITVIENYVKENFGSIGKKTTFNLLK
ncbi:MAG: 2-amino-4-hydroxy-6-hydroxymethyldihydropteridine diphosphokinase [Bacteroidota bacterium]